MAQSPQIHVKGLREAQKAAKQVDENLPKRVRERLKKSAEPAAQAVRAAYPKVSGKTAASVKAGATRTSAYVQSGKKSLPHVGWLEFGGTRGRPYRPEGRWLYPVVQRHAPRIAQDATNEVTKLLKDAGF